MSKEIFERPKLFYDIEVFNYDYLFLFCNEEGEIVYKVENRNGELSSNTDVKELLRDYTLVGFNNYNYDDAIVDKWTQGYYSPLMIKRLNDRIIVDKEKIWASYDFPSLDTMQELSDSLSLKAYMLNKGMNIIESSIPFDIDRALTDEEWEDTIKYCHNDILATIDLYKERYQDYFIPKKAVIELTDGWYKSTVTSITGKYLGEGTPRLFKRVKDEECLNLLPIEFQDHFNMIFNTPYIKDKKYKYEHYGMHIICGSGGIHGENKELSKKLLKNVYNIDFDSLYPNIIIKLDLFGHNTSKYKFLLDERFRYKKLMNEVDYLSDLYNEYNEKQSGFKLALNKTYGATGNQYNKLYDENKMTTVCYNGQIYGLILSDICYRKGYQVLQVNTDGVFIYNNGKLIGEDILKSIVDEVKSIIGINCSYDHYDLFIQKDVSCHIADNKGVIKVKGAGAINYEGKSHLRNNSLSIIDRCVVNKILYNKPFSDTIMECKGKPIMFQISTKSSRVYDGVRFGDEELQRVNRVFLTNTPPKKLVKYRTIDGNYSTTKFNDVPETISIFNGDLKDFDLEIDYNQYVKVAEEKYKKYIM